MYLKIDEKEVNAKFSRKQVFAMITTVTVAVSTFVYNAIQTKQELYDVKQQLIACRAEVQELKRLYKTYFESPMMPGNNPNRGAGATPVPQDYILIAPDFTKKTLNFTKRVN